MKTKLLLLSFTGALATRLSAQIAVTDAGVIQGQVEEMVRFVEMIQNQVQQISLLTAQLTQAQFVSRVMGDPAVYRTASGLPALLADLQSAGSNVARIALVAQSAARDAQQYDGGGLFHVIGESFQTLDGDVVHRDAATYKPQAAIIQTVANHDAVEKDVLQRRQNLRAAIQQTVAALVAATTDAEAQKLHGVLLAQIAELGTTDQELTFASQRVLTQEIDTRNDSQRQEAAAHEEQAAEFLKSLDHLRQLLRPPTGPVPLR